MLYSKVKLKYPLGYKYLSLIRIFRTRRWTTLLWTLLAMASLRLIRSWNQTGQKFAGDPDIVKIFLLPNPPLLWILVSITYIVVSFHVMRNLEGLPYVVITGITSVLVSAAFAFKLAFTAEDAPELVVGIARTLHDHFQGHSLLMRARIVFAVVALLVAVGIYNAVRGGPRASQTSGTSPSPIPLHQPLTSSSAHLIHHLYTILAITQSRVTNIPLLLLSHYLFQHLSSLPLSIPEITTTSILLQFASFFSFGGSNAISSVDLSSAYNGISGFNVFAVGFLTLVSNWAGPIYWTSATTLLLLEQHRWKKGGETKGVWRAHLTGLTIFTTLSVAFVMAACTALRTHLFIWTVFSPKYLYCMAWSLGQHLLINLGFGSALFWIGTRDQS
jgi:ethanolaminephosphotransferase